MLFSIPPDVLRARRATVAQRMSGASFLLAAGQPRPRNYAGAPYPFRASSHFLYLTGVQIAGAFLLYHRETYQLFIPTPAPDDALWHGASASLSEISSAVGCPAVYTEALGELLATLRDEVATLPTPDARGCAALTQKLGRTVARRTFSPRDEVLARAMVAARLVHDSAALGELTAAAQAAADAFAAGMRATRAGQREWTVRAAMEQQLIARGMTPSFNPIVSVHGEVLHNESSAGLMSDGDLLLVDFGAESRGGWASDVTRTWPVSGQFSPTQSALYDIVLAAQYDAIEAVKPGARYRDVHLAACRTMTRGLVDEGILRGDVDTLVEDGIHALFFPHGVGHLLGLDVHDMEDLGDIAGYAPQRARSAQFGLSYLRLDRDLEPGMAVTVEPGFYQVPAILHGSELVQKAGDRLNREVLARFADVRGIRIEDDVLVTEKGREVLTQRIPKERGALEKILAKTLEHRA